MTRELLFAGFFFAVFFYVLYQTFLVFSPFLGSIIWGAVLALTLFPLQQRLVRLLRGRQTVAAAIHTVLLVIVIVIPTFLFGSVLTSQAAGLYSRIIEILEQSGRQGILDWLTATPLGGLWMRLRPYVVQYDIDLVRLAQNTLQTVSATIVEQVTDVARSVPRLLLNLTIIIMTFFVFIRDGARIIGQLRDTVPMERAHTDAILATLYDTLSGVVQAMLATAVLQGILAGIGYWLAGMPFSLVLGVMSGFLSLIPYAVPLMWISCVIFLIVSGSLGSAIFLTLWGVLLIGSVDNIIRPLVIGERANLSAFLLFFAILGGLSVYGFLGLLLGPVLVAAVITLLQIYRLEYVTDRSAEGTDGTASS